MGVVTTEGIVLRYADYKESDRLIVLLSPELGKLTVSARGARKPKSRLLAGAQLFCCANYQLFRFNDTYTMSQVDLLDSFFNIRNDINKFAYAAYMMNLAEEAAAPNERADKLYQIVFESLKLFDVGEIHPQDITHAFEIKLVDMLGYRPVLENCSLCESSCENNNCVFNFVSGGLLCESCKSTQASNSLYISLSSIKTMRHMLSLETQRLHVLKVSKKVRAELESILPHYIEYVLDKSMKSRKLIEYTNNLN